jgi:hydroxypyruvate isomerase
MSRANTARHRPATRCPGSNLNDGAIPIPPGCRFDANVSILFPDTPLPQRPEAAAREGFDAIEMWWPFDRSVPAGSDLDRLVSAVRDAGVSLILLNLSTGNPKTEEHGLLCLPVSAHGSGRMSMPRLRSLAGSEVARSTPSTAT